MSAAALVMLAEVSAFADSRPRHDTRGRDRRDDGAWREDSRRNDDVSRRNDSRNSVTMEGRVRSVSRDGGGYRVRLDRGDQLFYVPQSALSRGGRRFDLRVGIDVRLAGAWHSRGYYYVHSIDWDDRDWRDHDRDRHRGNDRDYLRGVVVRIEHRGMVVREARSGRNVTVVMSQRDRNNRGVDFNDLRRGDRVTLAGDWERGNVFDARRIESVRSR